MLAFLAGCGGGGSSNPESSADVDWPHWGSVAENTHFADLDQVFAVDAATGKLGWTDAPPVDFLAGPGAAPSEPGGRGVTYGAGRIYVTTADDQLIALDAKTGKVRWKTRVIDPAVGRPRRGRGRRRGVEPRPGPGESARP